MALVPRVEKNISTLLLKLQPQVKRLEFTPEQRAIWDVVRAENNIMLRGRAQSGKSLAIAVLALNRALTHAPVKPKRFYDSLIVVPTDDLLRKYKFYLESAIADLPELCCPSRETQESEIGYETFGAEFVDTDGQSTFLSTGESKVPQLVVLTPSGLRNLLSKRKNFFSSIRLIALDDVDFMLSSTGCGKSKNFVQQGDNGKLQSKVLDSVKQILKVHRDTFTNKVKQRLHDVELRYDSNLSFAASKYVIDRPIESEEAFPENFNEKLVSKLLGVKNKLTYRPVQFCITGELNFPITSSIDGTEKTASQLRHLIDIHLKEDTFFLKERRLVDMDELNLDNHRNWTELFTALPPNVYFASAKSKSGYKKVKVKQLELNYLQGLSRLSFHIKELQTYCLNNHQKKYLRNRVMDRDASGFESMLRKALLKFYTVSKSTQPFLIVVPPQVDLKTIPEDCAPKFPTKVYEPSNSTESLEHFFSENDSHLCIHPHHLIGQSFSGVQNIMVVGLDSLLSATAFEKEVQPDHLLGLLNPNMDLLCFYLKKLMASRSALMDANLLFIKEDIARKSDTDRQHKLELDLEKLEQILLTSDIAQYANIKHF
ncbi:hypothetical protein C7M61_003104 [Candidozyma pseudohaemuli]|uniref:DEAD/DEAH-box helicase domain-containing protein n=1 Tax=Candidozyma pseudohaemuli TaxID=418784 RepID=A0A2P7YPG6_9ASCO|nr:hypothetical protein C7M61_003104 [[Candida] pseudohaemulonii]PSK37858.1 hypothetical protein C7M61_003104 [[Candida] pseudohaemulonii]